MRQDLHQGNRKNNIHNHGGDSDLDRSRRVLPGEKPGRERLDQDIGGQANRESGKGGRRLFGRMGIKSAAFEKDGDNGVGDGDQSRRGRQGQI